MVYFEGPFHGHYDPDNSALPFALQFAFYMSNNLKNQLPEGYTSRLEAGGISTFRTIVNPRKGPKSDRKLQQHSLVAFAYSYGSKLSRFFGLLKSSLLPYGLYTVAISSIHICKLKLREVCQ